MAGIHRSSTLTAAASASMSALGMAGIHRSSTLGRAELAEKQQVGAVSFFRKAVSAPEYLPALAVFCHRIPPFSRIDGL
jgi:hypothetical protein